MNTTRPWHTMQKAEPRKEDELWWEPNGRNTLLMIGDKYVGHFYEDASDGVDVEAIMERMIAPNSSAIIRDLARATRSRGIYRHVRRAGWGRCRVRRNSGRIYSRRSVVCGEISDDINLVVVPASRAGSGGAKRDPPAPRPRFPSKSL